jgi:hypothetical protein
LQCTQVIGVAQLLTQCLKDFEIAISIPCAKLLFEMIPEIFHDVIVVEQRVVAVE